MKRLIYYIEYTCLLNEKNTIRINFEVGPLYIFWVKNNRFDLDNFLYLQLTWATQINWTQRHSN